MHLQGREHATFNVTVIYSKYASILKIVPISGKNLLLFSP